MVARVGLLMAALAVAAGLLGWVAYQVVLWWMSPRYRSADCLKLKLGHEWTRCWVASGIRLSRWDRVGRNDGKEEVARS